MFWIFLYCFVSFHALTKQFVFNKIFNLLYKRSPLFILHMKQSLWSQVQAKDTKLQPHSSTCLDRYLAVTEGRLTKLFIGGSGLILRPAQPPFRCHKPLEGRMPSQRLRPALPMIRLLWSMLDTRPTVTMQVSSTCVSVTRWHQLKKIWSWSFSTSLNVKDITWTCRFDGSWTIAVPLTLRSKTPLVPENQLSKRHYA